MKCPRCAHDNQPGQKFCGECGARLALACPSCRSSNPPAQKFCGECGAALVPEAAPTSGSPESITPRHLAEKILTSKAALEGERKQVTVLFTDLKGSMELLADRDPEEARRILDPVLERMMEAVHRYEGTVNQVMGDGIMALFGAPLAHEDHAVRACYAALRMQEMIRRYTEELRRTHGAEVQIRVGLNSGEVVVRSIGSDLRMDYTAVGQTTHLAARMEQLAAPGTTRLTAETLALAEGYVEARSLGLVPIKGVAEPVEVFDLVGAGAARTRLQAARVRGLSAFVGRDAELEQIRQSAEQARHGHGQVVGVMGEAGVGKSRLFHEFIRSHHTQGWRVLEASSVSYGKATPFLPLADLLRGYFRIDDRDDPRSVRAKATGTVLTLDRALDDTVSPLLWVLDGLDADDPFLALDPPQRRRRTIDSVKRLLLRESRVQPLLLVFEDLHWVDTETQAVLDSLVEGLPTAPVLLAVNYRPEYRHAWGGKTYYRQLRVDPLLPASADALLDALLGHDPSVVPLKARLIARTEGNPLFLEESVRTLAETGVLHGAVGAYRLAGDPAAVQVPGTVQAIIGARIDRLRPELKRLLQAAAVIGKDVPRPLLAAIAEIGEDALPQALAELQAAELLYEARLFPEIEYTFKHALTHEVAYGSILADRRRALHAAIVDAIEQLYATRLAEHVEVLAHHASRGALTGQAVKYLREAGTRAVARSANREAVDFFERALALVAEQPETSATMSEALDIRIALGAPLILLHGPNTTPVEDSYRAALELVDRVGDVSRRFLVLWGRWYIRFTSGDYGPAVEAGQQLMDLAMRGTDVGHLIEAHHSLWPTLVSMGRPWEAVPHMQRGIALYDASHHASLIHLYGGHDPGACCRYYLGLAQWLLGQPDQGLAMAHEALRLAERLKHPLSTVIALWFLSIVQYERGERSAAALVAERAIALSDAHGYPAWRDDLVPLLHHARRDALTVSDLRDVERRLGDARPTLWRRFLAVRVLAAMYAELDHPDEGLRVLAAQVGDAGLSTPEIHRLTGDLTLQAARAATDRAEQCFLAALDDAGRRREKAFELRAAMSLYRLRRARGDDKQAYHALSTAYATFEEGLSTADLSAARALLG
ncbi:MAG TPA: adenylate/guanylate cyclase domain-containing protein [Methylomirabilota bacterium]|nr:adenylate/guanylate cyclase domain-containing protein [Methylomirabilota bacterium]